MAHRFILVGLARKEPDALQQWSARRQLAHALTNGKFARTWLVLILNFDKLNPPTGCVGKQYSVDANVDHRSVALPRIRVMVGDFIELNSDGIRTSGRSVLMGSILPRTYFIRMALTPTTRFSSTSR
jgi:hypothetical protein